MKRLLLVLALGVLLAMPAGAQAGIPSYQDRIDAKEFARIYWGNQGLWTDCYGVTLRFNGQWRMYGSLAYVAYARPCTIVFNKSIQWGRVPGYGWADDWWRFCVTLIHEYGHLPGIGARHSRNPNSIMAATEALSQKSWWWPFHPECRYEGDDQDEDGLPDYRMG